jgi:hypothetical protein
VGGESIFGIRHWWNSRKLQKLEETEDRMREVTIARLRKESAELEARVSWRRLSKEQQSLIADHLKRFSGIKIGVSFLGGNPEASDFANDILEALSTTKLDGHRLQPFSLFGGFGGGVFPLHPTTGVNVSTIEDRGHDVSEAIRNALCSIGFDAAITPTPPADPRDPKIDVEVLVVGRPITAQGATKLTINAKTKACIGSD